MVLVVEVAEAGSPGVREAVPPSPLMGLVPHLAHPFGLERGQLGEDTTAEPARRCTRVERLGRRLQPTADALDAIYGDVPVEATRIAGDAADLPDHDHVHVACLDASDRLLDFAALPEPAGQVKVRQNVHEVVAVARAMVADRPLLNLGARHVVALARDADVAERPGLCGGYCVQGSTHPYSAATGDCR